MGNSLKTNYCRKQIEYALKHLPAHLFEQASYDQLRDLLTRFNFLQRKIETISPQALIRDYEYTGDGDLRSRP